MGLSETIIAASIGAAATVAAAAFQLMTMPRPNKVDSRAKRSSPVRSFSVMVLLMVASAASGFLYAEFRNERTAQDLSALREELNAKLQTLAATTERIAEARAPASQMASVADQGAARPFDPGSVESVVYAPACGAGSECTEANVQPVALCGAIPTSMQARKFELFIKGAAASEATKAEFEQDLGGAKFRGPPSEFPYGDDRKNVCVSFWHWSAEPHIATLVLHYGMPVDIGPAAIPQPASSTAPSNPLSNTQTVSMTAAKP